MPQILRRVAAKRPGQVALSDMKTSLGWDELADLCEQSVRAIDSLGLPSGSRIAVVMRNSVDAIDEPLVEMANATLLVEGQPGVR
ncbi:MAG: hypothetical protein ACKO8T_06425 [Actinomycetota bacterium]